MLRSLYYNPITLINISLIIIHPCQYFDGIYTICIEQYGLYRQNRFYESETHSVAFCVMQQMSIKSPFP